MHLQHVRTLELAELDIQVLVLLVSTLIERLLAIVELLEDVSIQNSLLYSL